MISASPSAVFRNVSSSSPRGWRLMNHAPKNAEGTEPMHRSLTSSRLTVLLRR